MSEQENTSIVHQAYANFKSGDIAALLAMLSEDVQWQLPEIEDLPFAGKRQGPEQVGQFFASLSELQDNLEFTPQSFTAQGDKVVAQGHYRWRVKATGREYGADWAHVFTIRDGKVVDFHEYTDSAAVVAAYQQALSA
ncbi:MAG TPA: nuclear transport factor 2 family protein [Blastocatellia bacterium]